MVQRMLASGLIAAACSLAPLWVCRAQAQDLSKALFDITNTADRICGIVATHGNATDVKVRGDVQAELSGLIKKLADLGVSVSADASKTTYDGVMHKDLPDTLSKVMDCKFKVFNTLQDKLIPSEPKGSAPSVQKSGALPQRCDEVPFTPDNMGPGMIPPGVSDVTVKPNPSDPCSTGGTWRKIGDVWRKTAD